MVGLFRISRAGYSAQYQIFTSQLDDLVLDLMQTVSQEIESGLSPEVRARTVSKNTVSPVTREANGFMVIGTLESFNSQRNSTNTLHTLASVWVGGGVGWLGLCTVPG